MRKIICIVCLAVTSRAVVSQVILDDDSDEKISPVRFSLHCNTLASARLDPDTFLGKCASHAHTSFGAEHLATTCAVPGDRSMYWIYFKKANGSSRGKTLMLDSHLDGIETCFQMPWRNAISDPLREKSVL
ncbi:hypothetical protein TetV_628 [Tetraselmis virus 1]|uniref:Uncharacterized protein n=1 Tax=Tetraselmis virus 1 TaxID=2060617 RepID=A0A2P0VPA5_9VIRU|nr:hypothetical protein QJ968_gp426 [Tetraselmis virus 1]AUF82710.1 hypothetical protein TetV_628 [Tetraselmis virus 1]